MFSYIYFEHNFYVYYSYYSFEQYVSPLGLTNDHKVLMAKIEEGLHQIHALTKANSTQQATTDVSNSRETEISETSEPFLRINLISPGSPAESAVC